MRRITIIRAAAAIIILATVVIIIGVVREDDFVAEIRNHSAFTLTDVEVNGGGVWTQPVPDIPPGDKVSVVVQQVFSESGLGIRFVANETELALGDIAYVVRGGRGTTASFTVAENLDITATHYLLPSWLLLP